MKKHSCLKTVLLLLSLAVIAFLSLALGSVALTPGRILDALAGGDRTAYVILFELRLPRMLAAMLAGAGLACAGLLLQTVTDNELCAPNIIGVNSGAGFAVILFLALFPMKWRLLPIAAFVGALVSTLLVLAIARAASGEHPRSTLVLAGVAVSSITGAGISYLSLRYPDALVSYSGFTVGGFSGVTLDALAVPSVMIVFAIAVARLIAPRLGLLRLGDDAAAVLGVNVRLMRIFAVILASAMCASAVSFAGLIGFVGLIVPHIVRRIFTSELRLGILYTALCGANITLLSDLLGRLVIAPGELSAGVIMSLVGAPFFVYLLIRRRKNR